MQTNQSQLAQHAATIEPGAAESPPVTDLHAKGMRIFDQLLNEALDQTDRQLAAFDVTMTDLYKMIFQLKRVIDSEWVQASNSIEDLKPLLGSLDLYVRLTKQAEQYEKVKILLSKQRDKS